MNILVVNDDGIKSTGIMALVEALSNVADVYVCAPEGQRSGNSQSITIGKTVYVKPVDFPGAMGALETTGTPADCAKIGIQFFKEEGNPIDMVYAGINLGSNLGKDTLYSGTVGAALEGAVSGIHSVAVSVDSHQASHFDVACEMAIDVIDFVLHKTTVNTVLNINVPDLPREEIKGIRYTSLGSRYYIDKFDEQEDGGFILEGEPTDLTDISKDLDVTATNDGYASITPLQFDYTEHEMIDTVSKWGLTIRKE